MGETARASVLEGTDLAHLGRDEAERIVAQGNEAIVFALLTLSAQVAQAQGSISPSTPSSQIPVYEKENTSCERKKNPGRKPGREGAHRSPPERIDRTVEHTFDKCPECGGPVAPPTQKRTRVIEDVLARKPEATEHVIPRCYCKRCRKMVEPVVADAFRNAAKSCGRASMRTRQASSLKVTSRTQWRRFSIPQWSLES